MPNPRFTFSLALLLSAAIPACATAGPSDARITADIGAAYDQNAALRAPNDLHVQTLDQVVYLTGLVATEPERRDAESIALQMPGVERVVDSIAVINQ